MSLLFLVYVEAMASYASHLESANTSTSHRRRLRSRRTAILKSKLHSKELSESLQVGCTENLMSDHISGKNVLEEIDENLEKLVKKCQVEGFNTGRNFQNFDLKSLISGFDEIISSPLGQEIDRTLTKKIISNLTVLRNGFGVEFLGRDGSELDKLLKCCQFDYRHKNLFKIQN